MSVSSASTPGPISTGSQHKPSVPSDSQHGTSSSAPQHVMGVVLQAGSQPGPESSATPSVSAQSGSQHEPGSSPATPSVSAPTGSQPGSESSADPSGSQPAMGVVPQAALGFRTGAADYNAGRPSYTPATVGHIVGEVITGARDVTTLDHHVITSGVSNVRLHNDDNNNDEVGLHNKIRYHVVELGAGTGNMTEVLKPRLPPSLTFLAVEPSREFHDYLAAKKLGIDTVVASASAIPLPDRSVEAVVCAQSFHWFSDAKSIQEIHRVLVPGGKLIIAMNMKSFNAGWMKVVLDHREKLYSRTGASAKYLINTKQWEADLTAASGLFQLKQHVTLPGIEFSGDLEKIIHNLTTVSVYKLLPKAELDKALDGLRRELTEYPGVDVGWMTIPFSSEIYTYVRR